MSLSNKYANVEYHRWKLDDIEENGTNFIMGSYNQHELTKKIHNHEFIQIYFISKGILKHSVNNETGYVARGDIFIIPPGIYHLLQSTDNKDIEFISIGFMPSFIDFTPQDSSFLSKFLSFILIQNIFKDEIRIKPTIAFTQNLQVQVENIVTDMLMEYSLKREGYYLYIKGQLLRLLTIIGREYLSDSYYKYNKERFNHFNDAILESIRYINNNFTEDLKIDNVASRFYLSRTYFCDLFKKYTGKTFNEYLNDQRLHNAKYLLRTTSYTITEIAFSSGFNNVTCFCRKFANKIGTSPSAFRKMQ